MSTEHQALFVIVLLVVAVAYLYWRVEILARQVRNLSDEIEHLEAAGNLTWKSMLGMEYNRYVLHTPPPSILTSNAPLSVLS